MATIYKVKTVEAIYNSLKQYLVGLSSTITNFNVGSRIRTMFESIAIVNHKIQYDFHTAIKKAIPLAVYNGFEFERNPGIQATGTLEFERGSPAGEDYVIPIGTGVVLDDITYVTTELGEIATGNTTSGQLAAECAIASDSGNIGIDAIDTSAGKGSFIDQPTGIETVSNPLSFTGGQDEESDEDRLKRFRIFINSLARSTVLGIETGAKTVDGVISATVVENDPSPGFLKLYVDDGSGTLSPTLKTAVEKVINGDRADRYNFQGYRGAGIQVTVLAPTIVQVAINIQVKLLQSSLADDGQIEILAKNALENYINTLGLEYDVILSEISTVIQNVSADVYDVVIIAPSSNVAISQAEKAIINTGSYSLSAVRIANP